MNATQYQGTRHNRLALRLGTGLILILLIAVVPILADTTQDYSITYTIALHTDSSALWNIEYRIPVNTPDDQAAFEQNTNSSPILSEESINQLMEQSAQEASATTGRPMAIENFHRFSTIQSSPTGTYGVIRYSFLWTNFTETGDTLTMGDVFVGGLYVPVGASLVVEVPPGYAVTSADPAPGAMNGNVIWYGPYSFDAGKPSLTLTPTGLPVIYLLIVVFCGVVGAGIIALLVYRRRQKTPPPETNPTPPGPEAAGVSDAELREVEERILNLVKESGGELYQSEIVERLILPKSTVSSALNALHTRGLVQKIRKGRENLIRVVPGG